MNYTKKEIENKVNVDMLKNIKILLFKMKSLII